MVSPEIYLGIFNATTLDTRFRTDTLLAGSAGQYPCTPYTSLMGPRMSKKKQRAHSPKSQEITEDAWFYDGSKGIDLTVWVNTGDGRKALLLTLPWRKVEAAVKRHNTFI